MFLDVYSFSIIPLHRALNVFCEIDGFLSSAPSRTSNKVSIFKQNFLLYFHFWVCSYFVLPKRLAEMLHHNSAILECSIGYLSILHVVIKYPRLSSEHIVEQVEYCRRGGGYYISSFVCQTLVFNPKKLCYVCFHV